MDVIKIYDKVPQLDNLVCAIGQFDGLVLKKQVDETYLTPLENKIKLIESLNIDYLIIINFTKEVASLDPELFVKKYLNKLGVKEVVVGFDFCFGKFGKGKPKDILKYSDDLINVTVINEIKFNDEKIGTTLIKDLLSKGNMELVSKLLGRYYSITSKVITGSKIGRTIGVPTANLEIKEDFFDVKSGVYSVIVKINNQKYLGVCNIGHNPSFNYQKSKRLEVHIIDFNDNIYDSFVEVSFIHFLREEKHFEDINLFKEQIKIDINNTLLYKDLIE